MPWRSAAAIPWRMVGRRGAPASVASARRTRGTRDGRRPPTRLPDTVNFVVWRPPPYRGRGAGVDPLQRFTGREIVLDGDELDHEATTGEGAARTRVFRDTAAR
jgi:hypothetical protein